MGCYTWVCGFKFGVLDASRLSGFGSLVLSLVGPLNKEGGQTVRSTGRVRIVRTVWAPGHARNYTEYEPKLVLCCSGIWREEDEVAENFAVKTKALGRSPMTSAS